jgi:hypothetical protein
MRSIVALLFVAVLSGSIVPDIAIAQTQPPSSEAPFDPAVEQGIRKSCYAECFKAMNECSGADEASQSRCATFSMTCFIGCRACVPAYRTCRTATPAGTHDECLQREAACVSEKHKAQEGRTDLIRFSGGDGSTKETAVVIEGARNEEEGIVAESFWASRNRFRSRKTGQALLNVNSRQLDQITYTSPDGKEEAVFFDVTAFFGKN